MKCYLSVIPQPFRWNYTGYLIGATPLTVFHGMFWNFADVFCMEWRCACGLSIIIWFFYFFFHFSALKTYSLFWHEMLLKCVDSGYLVGTTPLTVFLQLFWNFADVFCMEWRCACGLGILFDYYVPHIRGGGHIVFGVDPVGVGISVSVTLSCLHNISWTGKWILTKFAWM